MHFFPDHFSPVASTYARHRPTYPPELFHWIAATARGRGVAWDCAAGSGQATHALGELFDRVIATDASAGQVAEALPHPRVTWRVATAEASGLVSASVDVVTIAQALHWFDLHRFWAEVRRVVRPQWDLWRRRASTRSTQSRSSSDRCGAMAGARYGGR